MYAAIIFVILVSAGFQFVVEKSSDGCGRSKSRRCGASLATAGTAAATRDARRAPGGLGDDRRLRSALSRRCALGDRHRRQPRDHARPGEILDEFLGHGERDRPGHRDWRRPRPCGRACPRRQQVPRRGLQPLRDLPRLDAEGDPPADHLSDVRHRARRPRSSSARSPASCRWRSARRRACARSIRPSSASGGVST